MACRLTARPSSSQWTRKSRSELAGLHGTLASDLLKRAMPVRVARRRNGLACMAADAGALLFCRRRLRRGSPGGRCDRVTFCVWCSRGAWVVVVMASPAAKVDGNGGVATTWTSSSVFSTLSTSMTSQSQLEVVTSRFGESSIRITSADEDAAGVSPVCGRMDDMDVWRARCKTPKLVPWSCAIWWRKWVRLTIDERRRFASWKFLWRLCVFFQKF